MALLQGDAAKSVAILESLLGRRPAGGDKNAHVHAYLGVAYATQALSAPKPEDQARLREKAIDQFHLTLSAERDYRLSERLVSPKIRALYDLAHR